MSPLQLPTHLQWSDEKSLVFGLSSIYVDIQLTEKKHFAPMIFGPSGIWVFGVVPSKFEIQ
jgi:hypothetical protein